MTTQLASRPSTPPPGTPPEKRTVEVAGRRLRAQLPWIAITVAVGVLVLLPLVPLQGKAFGNGAAGIRDLWNAPGTADVFITTLKLALGTVVVGVLLGTALAFAMAAVTPRARRWLGFAPLLPMIVPGVAHVIGFVFLFSPENGYVNAFLRATPFFDGVTGPINVYTPFWIVVYTGVHLAGFVYLFVHTGLQNLGVDYDLAARVNGARPLRILFTVTLPLLRPSLLYSTVVVFILALGQFTGPLILGRREGLDVITTRMFDATQEFPLNYGLASALGTPLVIVALLLVLFQRRALGNQARFVGRGDASAQVKPPGTAAVRWGAAVFISLFFLIAALLPLAALVLVSLSNFWTGTPSFDALTLVNYREVFSDDQLMTAITTTLSVSAIAIAIVIPIGILVSWALHNRDRMWKPMATLLDVLAYLPLSMPAALVGFGFLFAYSLPWIGLQGSRTGLVLAYVTIMLPYAVRYQLAAMVSLGDGTIEASRVAGASTFRTLTRVVLPLCKRNIAASAAVIFVLLTHEFGVSVLLKGPDTTVLSVMLYERYANGVYPVVAVDALVMTVITGAGVVVAMLVGGRKAMEGL